VRVSGRAVGVVEVRDPTFALTLSHAATVTAGEEYDLLVTVSNTSESVANFVSVNLLPRSISGARLVSEETQSIETIAAGESATVAFRLLSQQTGNVVPARSWRMISPVTSSCHLGRALGIPSRPTRWCRRRQARCRGVARCRGGFLGQAFSLRRRRGPAKSTRLAARS
jgi:hypothetical protein